MTKAKAATVASALITADYATTIMKNADGTYTVQARATDGSSVSVDAVKSFADSQTITATVEHAIFN
jgi:hypothetical protein